MKKIVSFSVLAAFAMVATGGAAIAADPAKPALSDDKVVCKKSVDTGSLIRGKKRCMTRKQWNELAEATRQQMMDGQNSGSASGSN